MERSAARGMLSCRPAHATSRNDRRPGGRRRSSAPTFRRNARICFRVSLSGAVTSRVRSTQNAGSGGGNARWPGSARTAPWCCSTGCGTGGACRRSARACQRSMFKRSISSTSIVMARPNFILVQRAICESGIVTQPLTPGSQRLDLRLIEAMCICAQWVATAPAEDGSLNTLSTATTPIHGVPVLRQPRC